MRPVHCQAILALFLGASTLSAGAQPSLVDQLLKRYIRPQAVVGDGALHLVYQRKMDSQDRVLTCYRSLEPGKGWSKETEFQNDYVSVGYFAGSLFLFREDNYSIYRGADWRPHKWPLGWTPAAAGAVGDELWVFGADVEKRQHKLRAARFTREEPKAAEQASEAEKGKDTKAPGDSVTGPVPLGAPLALKARATDICVVPQAESAIVFWHQRGVGMSKEGLPTNELWSATFDGIQWGRPGQVAVPCDYSDYAVAEHAGQVWVVCKERGRRLSASNPLQAIRKTGTTWSAPIVVPNAVDSLFDWTFDVAVASFDGRLHVFRACMTRLVVHRWRDGRWEGLTTLSEIPPWATYALWWSLVNVVAGLALLPIVAVCALRSRGRTRQMTPVGDGELPVASWSRRVAAVLVDVLLTEFICTVTIALLSVVYGGETVSESVPLMLGLHLGVFFSYFVWAERRCGQTFGKRMLNIVVVGQDGRRPTFGGIVVRNLLRPWPFLVPAAYLAGSIVLLLTRRNQRVGDMLARTVVVEVPPPLPPKR